jgi:hypothetical protein
MALLFLGKAIRLVENQIHRITADILENKPSWEFARVPPTS